MANISIIEAIRNTIVAIKTWVENKGYLTEHQSLENYATKGYVNSVITDVSGGIGETLPWELAMDITTDDVVSGQTPLLFEGEASYRKIYAIFDFNSATNVPAQTRFGLIGTDDTYYASQLIITNWGTNYKYKHIYAECLNSNLIRYHTSDSAGKYHYNTACTMGIADYTDDTHGRIRGIAYGLVDIPVGTRVTIYGQR